MSSQGVVEPAGGNAEIGSCPLAIRCPVMAMPKQDPLVSTAFAICMNTQASGSIQSVTIEQPNGQHRSIDRFVSLRP